MGNLVGYAKLSYFSPCRETLRAAKGRRSPLEILCVFVVPVALSTACRLAMGVNS